MFSRISEQNEITDKKSDLRETVGGWIEAIMSAPLRRSEDKFLSRPQSVPKDVCIAIGNPELELENIGVTKGITGYVASQEY